MLAPNSISIGTDIVEISRFRSIQVDSPFFKRVFSEREMSFCLRHPDPAPHLAATFAAKEAVLKTMSRAVSMSEVEIIRDDMGAPHVELGADPSCHLAVSMSHSSHNAVAVAVRCPSALLELQVLVGLVETASRELLEGGTA